MEENVVDMRDTVYNKDTHIFYAYEVDVIETYGPDSDIMVRTDNGDFLFRCSCCVNFLQKGIKIQII